ncbi:MAG TPA: alpha/beta fold hydrolase [Jiangellales bacterium]|nr:alpha/beta fold hydrolase [Jiangellales bacterium]
MRFGVLGPIVVWDDLGASREPRGPRQRSLLGALLAAEGAVVPVDRLVDLLWGGEPPHNPAAALQSQVHRLRQMLPPMSDGTGQLVTRPPGYALVLPRDELDAGRFLALTTEAQQCIPTDPSLAVTLLEEALALWRGPAYAGLDDNDPVQLQAIRLEEARLLAQELRGEALVGAGRAAEAVPFLEAFVARHPLREQARVTLLRGLYALGRHADALAGYQAYRRQLADELGLEPGAAMRQLEGEILRHQVTTSRPAGGGASPQPTPPPYGGADRSGLGAVHVRYVDGPQGSPVAYATAGQGPVLVSLPGWISSIDVVSAGRDPRSSILHRLTADFTVAIYDRVGTGLSRGPVSDHGLTASAEELATVVGQLPGPVSLLAMSQAGPVAVALAAERPELVDRMVLFGTYADGPSTFTNEAVRTSLVSLIRAHWGMASNLMTELFRPEMSSEATRHLSRVLRDSADAETAADYLQAVYEASVTDLLPRVTAPALVLHYRNDRVIPFVGGRQLASGLPDARFIALDGGYHLPDALDLDRIAEEIRRFLLRR